MCILTIDSQPITGPVPWARATALARSFLRQFPALRREQFGFINP